MFATSAWWDLVLFDRVLSYFDCVRLVPAIGPASVLWVVAKPNARVGNCSDVGSANW